MENENVSEVSHGLTIDTTPTIQSPSPLHRFSDISSEPVIDSLTDEGTVPAATALCVEGRGVSRPRRRHIRPPLSSCRAAQPLFRRDASMPRRSRRSSSSCGAARQQPRPRTMRRSLLFPRRLRSLPPVKALRRAYTNVRGSNSLLSCTLMAVEVATLCLSAPAVAAWEPLLQMASTPLLVADLLLCKGLDMAQRALPCLAQTPQQMLEGATLCACGVPVGLAYMACKAWLRLVSVCVCDVPAVCVGVPAFAACAALECCLCDAPFALCGVPARVTAAAARLATGDARALISTLDKCSKRVLGPLGYVESSSEDESDAH